MTDRPVPTEVWRIAVVIVFGAFMAGLDTSLVNVGLDTIARELHAPLSAAQWLTSGYLLALAGALPACPWLQRRFGAVQLWLAAVLGFTITSALCAAAPTLTLLIVMRLLQGACGGVLVPAGQAVLGRAAGSDRMGRVMATAGVAVVLAPAVGPAIGGLLVAHLSWRWLFVVNVPIGVAALVLGLRILPRSAGEPGADLDVVGLLLLAVGLPTVTYGLIEVGASGTPAAGAALTVIGVALLGAFVVHSTRPSGRTRTGRAPLVDLALFARPQYAAAQVTVLCTGVGLFGGLIVLPLYYETLRGVDAGRTGLLLLAYGAGSAITLRLGGVLTDRFGGGLSCVIGLGTTAAATAPFIVLDAHANLAVVEALQFARGAGVSLAGLPAMSAAFTAAADHLADATTTANILQRVGGSVGTAAIVIVIERSAARPADAFHLAFAMLTATALVALVPAAFLTRGRRRTTAAKS